MDAGIATVGLGDGRRWDILVKKDAYDSKYKSLVFWLNVLFRWFNYQQKPQTDLCKQNYIPQGQITAPAKAQRLSEALGWKGFWVGLRTNRGHDRLVMSAMKAGGKSRNQVAC